MGIITFLNLTHGDYSFIDPEPLVQSILEGRGVNGESDSHEVG